MIIIALGQHVVVVRATVRRFRFRFKSHMWVFLPVLRLPTPIRKSCMLSYVYIMLPVAISIAFQAIVDKTDGQKSCWGLGWPTGCDWQRCQKFATAVILLMRNLVSRSKMR